MLPWSADLAGRIDEQMISSELLRGNPLGDPHERPLLVYLPPGYDDEPDRRYPSVYVIQGFTGHVAMWRNRSAFRQPFPEGLLEVGDVVRIEIDGIGELRNTVVEEPEGYLAPDVQVEEAWAR